MLTLYFSGTGNTKYIAELFSKKMDARCFSIEGDQDFATEIKANDTIAFCYPIYCSRVPRIMREFVHKHMDELKGKKIVILVTQMFFSGDGARVFTEMFEDDAIEVVYAEHFDMPLNMGNTFVLDLWKPTDKLVQRYIKNAEARMARVCEDIKNGMVKKRGFAHGSVWLGYIQGIPWKKFEKVGLSSVKIHESCTACNICIKKCPMENLVNSEGQIKQMNNCIVCYRCVNVCPKKAISVLLHRRPKWQYIKLQLS